MNGFIYKCTCLINGKIYIGQTIQDYNERWKDHIQEAFNDKQPSYNYKFHKAIRKYGENNFKWSILETVSCDNVENLLEILNNLEIKYIKQYDSFKNGYNSTKGGNSFSREFKEVIAYNELGNKIKTFESVNDASEYYKTEIYKIRSCCERSQYCVLINNKKIIFRYSDDICSLEDIEKVKNISKGKTINTFNLSGKMICRFESADDAQTYFNIKKSRIIACCNRQISCVRFNNDKLIFRYSDDKCTNQDLYTANHIIKSKISVKCIDSVTKEVLGVYESMQQAGEIHKVQKGKISEVCSGKRKSAGKHNGHPLIWKIIEQ